MKNLMTSTPAALRYLGIAAGIFTLAATAHAQVTIASYNFDEGSLTSSATSSLATASSITFGSAFRNDPFTSGIGPAANLNENNDWSPSDNNAGDYAWAFSDDLSRNQTGALDGDHFISFSITPASTVDLSSLQFWGRRSFSNVGDTTVFLRSSLDDFASNLASGTAPFNNNESNSLTFDLSTVSELQNISSETTFRLYAFTSATEFGRVIAIDDIRVSAIPEPSQFALIAGLGFGLIALARRRSRS